MKKLFKFNALLLFSAILIIGACKKKDNSAGPSSNNNNTPTTPTKTQLLTSKNWKVTAQYYTNNSNGAYTDVYALRQTCQNDDYVTFSTNGTYIGNSGATKCNASDPQTYGGGTWSFNSDESAIIMVQTSPSGTSTATINQISSTTLKYTIDANGYTTVTTFTAM